MQNDIESFEILKDPSSLAIFGVRGANGVIIVTTKRAKMGQTVVNVNQSVGVKHVGHRMSLIQRGRSSRSSTTSSFRTWAAIRSTIPIIRPIPTGRTPSSRMP